MIKINKHQTNILFKETIQIMIKYEHIIVLIKVWIH